jgi:hypothetical protein
MELHWGRELVKNDLSRVQVELSERAAIFQTCFVTEGFFSKAESVIKKRLCLAHIPSHI